MQLRGAAHRQLGADGAAHEAHSLALVKRADGRLHRRHAKVRDRGLRSYVLVRLPRPAIRVVALPLQSVAVAVEPNFLLRVALALLIRKLVPIKEADVPSGVQPWIRELLTSAWALVGVARRSDSLAVLGGPRPSAGPAVEVDDGVASRVEELMFPPLRAIRVLVPVLEPRGRVQQHHLLHRCRLLELAIGAVPIDPPVQLQWPTRRVLRQVLGRATGARGRSRRLDLARLPRRDLRHVDVRKIEAVRGGGEQGRG
mmetsp:Transcript_43498/g.131610  ORF Transcript_43498/g.131610 Transcript_43498/m.131610 type:complete len:256 (-) Transcript_43498:31-798(-)